MNVNAAVKLDLIDHRYLSYDLAAVIVRSTEWCHLAIRTDCASPRQQAEGIGG